MFNKNKIEKFDNKCFIVKIKPETISERGIYGAARWAWRAKLERVKKSDYVLAVKIGSGGEVVGVLEPEKWYKATAENDKKYGHNLNEGCSEETEKRIAFIGKEAPEHIKNKYLHKYLPDEFMKKGDKSVFRYTYS